jgi:hypothetical protein
MDRNKYYGGDSASMTPLEDVRILVFLCRKNFIGFIFLALFEI